MEPLKSQLESLFQRLDQKIEELNRQRRADGLIPVSKAKVQLLGQVSLLANEKVSVVLTLATTGDLDAFLRMDEAVKSEFIEALKTYGWVYDEDSYLIWIPPGAFFTTLFDLGHILVESIDPESALVSKAVKAPVKNKILIREAIASEKFPTLVERIVANGGLLKNFL
jgi:hypothetical protein